jgi:hypothetical protein
LPKRQKASTSRSQWDRDAPKRAKAAKVNSKAKFKGKIAPKAKGGKKRKVGDGNGSGESQGGKHDGGKQSKKART